MDLTERILRTMEDRRDFNMLAEMNGRKCAKRQFNAFAKGDIRTQAEIARIEHQQRLKRAPGAA